MALQPGPSLVEVGCGTARNLIAIARRYPEARLYGLDASAAMLETARASECAGRARAPHQSAAGPGRRTLARRVRTVRAFDHVLFSYSLSMIPDWRGALAAGFDALSPEGGCIWWISAI